MWLAWHSREMRRHALSSLCQWSWVSWLNLSRGTESRPRLSTPCSMVCRRIDLVGIASEPWLYCWKLIVWTLFVFCWFSPCLGIYSYRYVYIYIYIYMCAQGWQGLLRLHLDWSGYTVAAVGPFLLETNMCKAIIYIYITLYVEYGLYTMSKTCFSNHVFICRKHVWTRLCYCIVFFSAFSWQLLPRSLVLVTCDLGKQQWNTKHIYMCPPGLSWLPSHYVVMDIECSCIVVCLVPSCFAVQEFSTALTMATSSGQSPLRLWPPSWNFSTSAQPRTNI